MVDGVQGFMWDQLLKLNEMAVLVPLAGNDPIMPEIAFADTRSEFVGEAIQRGINAAKATFKLDAKAKPDLIFVNLPNKGAPCPLLLQALGSEQGPLRTCLGPV